MSESTPMRMTRVRICLCGRSAVGWFTALVLSVAGLVSGQSQPADPDRGPTERHGWAVLPMGESHVLVHLPPRARVPVGRGRWAEAQDGELLLARRLRIAPERVVASGRTAFLVFAPERAASAEPVRLVLSVTARPAPMGGRWTSDASARLTAQPGLPGAWELLDVVGLAFEAGAGESLAALVRPTGETGVELRVLDGRSWVAVSLPSQAQPEPGAALRLIETGHGVLLVSSQAGGRAWRGHVTPGRARHVEPVEDDPQAADVVRTPPEIVWEAVEFAAVANLGEAVVFEVGGLILSSQFTPANRWVVRYSGDGSAGEFLSIEPEGLPLAVVVTGYGSSTRLVLIERAGPTEDAQKLRGDKPRLRSSIRLIEVSVGTGRVLYDGPTHAPGPISTGEFQLLAALAFSATIGVLIFVLWPDRSDGVVRLPAGTALAEPFRRAMAGGIDLSIAIVAAALIVGDMGIAGLADAPIGDVRTILAAIGIAFGHGVLGEWLFSRTMGKALLGCRVVSTATRGGSSARLSVRQSLVRNFVKFVVPPVAALGLSDPNGRHRGDVLAETVVVISAGSAPGPEGEGVSVTTPKERRTAEDRDAEGDDSGGHDGSDDD